MGVGPGYGETPLDPEEADALTPQAREIFGDEPKKIDLYEAAGKTLTQNPGWDK